VVNRIKPKVEGLIGLYMLRNTDPKVYPRTQKHEDSAHAVTDALRFVSDNQDFESTKRDVANDFFVEGYGGAIVEVKQGQRDIEIFIHRIPWDRIYFDPHSRELDFDDARYFGMMIWMGADQIVEMFPDVDLNEISEPKYEDETFEDRPRWMDRARNRYRLAYHFRIHEGVWKMSIFCGDYDVVEEIESPFLDDEGNPTCPIELVSANVDRDNQRYGEVRAYIDLQDEMNHRRSKALHLLSQRQTAARSGAIKNIPALKRELAKPDGHIEYQGEKGDFEILGTGDMAKGQFELYQDGKSELDAVGMNAQLAGERQQGDLSGRAIEKLQSAGTMELNRQYGLLNNWEKRIYKQVWARIKQFWTEEKWIRVTDDQDSLRWVGLNHQVTMQEFLKSKIEDEALPLQVRQEAFQALQTLLQAQAPELNQVIEIKNPVPEMEMDIVVDQSFDTINVQQEQFRMIAEFAQSSKDIDVIELIELSDLRNKEDLIDKIERRRQQAAQAAGNTQQLQAQEMQVNMAKTAAETQDKQQSAFQKQIENNLLLTQPERVSSVAV